MNDPRPDPCEFLDPESAFQVRPAFRAAVLKETIRLLHRRRWMRRVGLVAALAACYLAGLGSMRLWLETRQRPAGPVQSEMVPAPVAVHSAPRVILAADEDASPLELEKIASLVPAGQRADWYRRAGDRYWQDTADVQAAFRCYRLSLAAGSEKAWAVSIDDNWLLMALKRARQKEKDHANADG